MTYGRVYKITCTVNNKSYVGLTTRSINHRLALHKYYAKCGLNTLLSRAIRKHGTKNFTIELLGEALDRQSLDELEVYHILRLETLCPGGYNNSTGGVSGGNMSEDARKKMKMRRPKYEHQGQEYAMSDLYDKFCRKDISLNDLYMRLVRFNWPIDRALTRPSRGGLTVEYMGQTLKLREARRMYAISSVDDQLFTKRIKSGWDVAKALKTPPRGK